MPIVTINMVAGRPRSAVQECLREVAKVVSNSLSVPLTSVRVLANEVDPELWAVGETLKSDSSSKPQL